MTPQEWLASPDTGRSSEAIFFVMMKVITKETDAHRYDIPYDAQDFGRCVRLLNLFPDWRKRIWEVGLLLPKWKPLTDAWPELEALYAAGVTYMLTKRLLELRPDCMTAAGWVKVAEGHWVKGNSVAFTSIAESVLD